MSLLFLSWIPDQCHLACSVTSGMTWPEAWRTANAVSMDDRKVNGMNDRSYCCRRCLFLARRQLSTSFRAWPGIQSLSLHGSRINATSQTRWRPGWRMFGSSGIACHVIPGL